MHRKSFYPGHKSSHYIPLTNILKFLCILLILALSIFIPVKAIVPKQGISIERYEAPAASMNNIGHLMVLGKKISSCSATLVGVDGNIGVVLTAGHCADFTAEEAAVKCRHKTISFSSSDTYEDNQKLPIIGRYALSEYIDASLDYEYDIGVIFIDMSDYNGTITPKPIQLKKNFTSSIVHVVGYGKSESSDSLKRPKRRVMSTQALPVQKNGHNMLLLDEEGIKDMSIAIPVGDHPAEGDSGGPVIDPDTEEIIGVVSHKQGNNVYSEPVYEHIEWLLEQMRYAGRYFIFHLRKSGKFSQVDTWAETKPNKFKNAYGEINPIVLLKGQKSLTLDENPSIYAINLINDGGAVITEGGLRYVEMIRADAPATLTSTKGGTLVTDEFKVGNPKISLQTRLQVLHQFQLHQGITLDLRIDDPHRGITLVNKGKLKIEGTLKLHHINFHPSLDVPVQDMGLMSLLGNLEVEHPLHHFAHVIEVSSSTPGKIKGDYVLDKKGILTINIDTSASSAPILDIEGSAILMGGEITLKGNEILPLGFERNLLFAQTLKIIPKWQGTYATTLVDDDAEIIFSNQQNALKMKVIPKTIHGRSLENKDEYDPLSK